jgi:hypothetical protein
MIHRTLVQRDTQTATNAHNHKGTPTWSTHIDALACFLYVPAVTRGREDVAAERTVAIRGYAMLVPLGTDVTERDRISGVEDRAGDVILSGVMNIRAVIRHHNHIELALELPR